MSQLRQFNHDEAVSLYSAGGVTYADLAERYGVSASAIQQVVKRRIDPEYRERMNEYNRLYMREHLRGACEGGCDRLVWKHPGRSGLCRRCLDEREHGHKVRPDELQCNACGEWKPDAKFYPAAQPAPLRRGHKSVCRSCETDTRRSYRERHRAADRAYQNQRRAKLGSVRKEDCGPDDRCRGCGTPRRVRGNPRAHLASCPLRRETLCA